MFIAKMAGRKIYYNTEQALAMILADSGAELIPQDSSSDDEDIIQPQRESDSDPDYRIPTDERYIISVLLMINVYRFTFSTIQ